MTVLPKSLVTIALILVLCGPVFGGESLPYAFPDTPTDFLSKLSAQVSAATNDASEWVIVNNSPEDGFAAGILNQTNDTILIMTCIPDEDEGEPLRGILISWFGTTTILGSYYDHLDEIPVYFRWSDDVNQANRRDWFKIVDEDTDITGVLGLDGEVTNILDRVVETSAIFVAVRKSPTGSSYARTNFAWSNDPPVEGMEDCGQGQIEDPFTPDGDGFECERTAKEDGGFVLDCSPRP